MFDEDHYVKNFKEKVTTFNFLFVEQCSLIKDNSKRPSYINYLLYNLLFSLSFSQDTIAEIIQNFDSNEAHGHDKSSICMLKQCIKTGISPSEWRKVNNAPIYKTFINRKVSTWININCWCTLGFHSWYFIVLY